MKEHCSSPLYRTVSLNGCDLKKNQFSDEYKHTFQRDKNIQDASLTGLKYINYDDFSLHP